MADPKQILKISGRSQFFEVMLNTLSFDRVYINFEQYDDSKPKGQRKQEQVKIYLECLEAYILAKDIFSGRMAKLSKHNLDIAKKGGYKYAREIYSKLGGISASKLASRGKDRKDKMSLSRQFKITPGNKLPWILSAETGPGEESETGLIVPKYKRPEQIIRVGLTDEQFKMFASALELITISWMNDKVYQNLNEDKKS
jgi:hypothetical protein